MQQLLVPRCLRLALVLAFLARLFPASTVRAEQPLRLPPAIWQPGPLFTPSPEPELSPASEIFLSDEGVPTIADVDAMRPNFAELFRPTVGLAAEWHAEASDVDLIWYRATLQIPTYPFFGPPPPMLTGGFTYTSLSAPETLNLPAELYDYSLGASWMRPLAERWMLRLTASAALATDGQNTSSDAWQFRGGLFAIHRRNEQWTWILGALALGRNDLPVVPAVGAIWQPAPHWRFDLTFPRPRANWLVIDSGPRQQWVYLGAGLEGNTWGIERAGGVKDQLTYRDWRVLLGWESVPTPEPGMPFARGRKWAVDVGYAFAREFEFDSGAPSIEIDGTLLVRVTAEF